MTDDFINDEFEEDEDELDKTLAKIYNSTMKAMFLSDTVYNKLRGPIELIKARLSLDALNLILSSEIFIIRIETPACRLSNSENKSINHIIAIDLNILTLLGFTDKEISAVILHEIGHILNVPDFEKDELKEFYADDYVRKQGSFFENELLSGLKKYLDKSPVFLTEKSKEEIISRINRIEDKAELYVDGKIRS